MAKYDWSFSNDNKPLLFPTLGNSGEKHGSSLNRAELSLKSMSVQGIQ